MTVKKIGTAVRAAAAVLWGCHRCSMRLLDFHANTSCALCGVAAASSCYATCVCCMILLRPLSLPLVVGLTLHAVVVEFIRT